MRKFSKPRGAIIFSCLISIILTAIQSEVIFQYDDNGLLEWRQLILVFVGYFLITIFVIMAAVLMQRERNGRKDVGRRLNAIEKVGLFLVIISIILVLITLVALSPVIHLALTMISLLIICVGAGKYWRDADKLSISFLFWGIALLLFIFLLSTDLIVVGVYDQSSWEENWVESPSPVN